jgi:hypothetical protein
MPDDDQEPITRRDSGSLEVFETTATEALSKLVALGLDAEGETLAGEARQLVTILRAWRVKPPHSAERPPVVERVLTLHRAVEEYLVARRSSGS